MDFQETILHSLHTNFFKRFLKKVSSAGSEHDTIRPTITYFVISGLDILKALDSTLSITDKERICDWIYGFQIVPESDPEGDNEDIADIKRCGFQGALPLLVNNENTINNSAGHLAMTYSSLCTLLILGDDLSRVQKVAILKGLKYLQQENGSFLSSTICGETDIRFVYCAAAICYILNDWRYIDVDKAVNFIVSSLGYDGGVGQSPYLETHGGSSFCGIAALSLMGRLHSSLSPTQIDRLERWLLLRQESTFQGRPNKYPDTCYSFWIGATLKLLNSFQYANWDENRKYLLDTQGSRTGGFSKWSSTSVDLLHSYFGLCGLSLMNEKSLEEIHPSLNISKRAHNHLLHINGMLNEQTESDLLKRTV